MNTFKKIAMMASFSAVLTGCIPYTVPSDSSTAKLGVLNESILNNNVIAIFDDPIDCEGPKVLENLSERLTFDGKPHVIQANKLTTLLITHTGSAPMGATAPVRGTITFYADAGQTYFISSNEGSAFLTTKLLKQTRDGAHHAASYSEVPFIERQPGILSGCNDPDVQQKLRNHDYSSLLNKR